MITGVCIDSREPLWLQSLTFGNVPTAVIALETGDIQAVTEDGCTLCIERKSPEDLLNSLRDDRLLPQMARMVQARLDEQANGTTLTWWPYLVITGALYRGPNGKTVTGDRGVTGWDFNAVQGALLTIQEMGVMVVYAGDDTDFENCVIRLSKRERGEIKIVPPRPPHILGAGAAFLAGLPGVGPEHALKLMEWSENIPAHALSGITDLEITGCPLGMAARKRIRAMLGLQEKQDLELSTNSQDQIILDVFQEEAK